MPNDDYMSAKAWPFEQARALLKRLDIEKKRGIDRGDRPVTFETGYGRDCGGRERDWLSAVLL